jgi:hypothetical protein
MQARNELPAAGAVPVAAADVVGAAALVAADVGDVVGGALVVLLPQAASNRLTVAAAAVVIHAVCLTVSSTGSGFAVSPGVTGLPPRPRLPAD